ncbi:NPCBM/NEW2 domain-containing protein [Bacillus salipaludis]|uniref:NPCBM/NEW2 domain-containing protein n=1 Tax=Bacillus salipaludis TaxID=2547811 RepID=UPI003D2119D2
MNFKIFSVLVALIFSFAIIQPSLTVSAATSKASLEKKIKTLEAQVKKQKKEITTLNSQLDSKKKEVSLKDSQLSTKTKEINSLKSQIAVKNKEISTLKSKIPVVSTGKLYKDGILSGTSQFISMADKDYVELKNIIPLLSVYDANRTVYNRTTKNLFLGVVPQNGHVSLTSFKPYSVKEAWAYSYEIKINRWADGQAFTINNQRYSWGIGASTTYFTPSIEYKLQGKYKKIKFKYGLDDTTDEDARAYITISGDGRMLFDSDNLDIQEDAKEIDLDITGINMIKFDFHYVGDGNSGSFAYPVVAEPVLIP